MENNKMLTQSFDEALCCGINKCRYTYDAVKRLDEDRQYRRDVIEKVIDKIDAAGAVWEIPVDEREIRP